MVKRKLNVSHLIADIIKIIVLIALAAVCLLPMWHVIMGSLSDPLTLAASNSFLFFPISGKFSIEGWKIVFRNNLILRGYLNTIFYTTASTVLGVFLSMLGAYVLSKKKLFWKVPIIVFLIIPMFVSGGLIPFYIVVYNLGMTNTVWAMIIPGCCNIFGIILIRNGIASIPESVIEASEIDGAQHMTVLLRIVLPLSVPYIAVVAMFSVIGQWNSWLNASLFISKAYEKLYPLQLIVREIIVRGNTGGVTAGSGIKVDFYKESIQLVTIVASSLPLILIYPFVQKHFEKAVILGGVKG